MAVEEVNSGYGPWQGGGGQMPSDTLLGTEGFGDETLGPNSGSCSGQPSPGTIACTPRPFLLSVPWAPAQGEGRPLRGEGGALQFPALSREGPSCLSVEEKHPACDFGRSDFASRSPSFLICKVGCC